MVGSALRDLHIRSACMQTANKTLQSKKIGTASGLAASGDEQWPALAPRRVKGEAFLSCTAGFVLSGSSL